MPLVQSKGPEARRSGDIDISGTDHLVETHATDVGTSPARRDVVENSFLVTVSYLVADEQVVDLEPERCRPRPVEGIIGAEHQQRLDFIRSQIRAVFK